MSRDDDNRPAVNRSEGRAKAEIRNVAFTTEYTRHAEGSVLAAFGGTRVLCTASVADTVPGFLRGQRQGWVTAEYGMLPRATHTRSSREARRGQQSGRTLEIQRLIGRSLRAVVDLQALGERTITLDCDVLQADGGTRTASVSGAYVALVMATEKLLATGKLRKNPCTGKLRRYRSASVPGRRCSISIMQRIHPLKPI